MMILWKIWNRTWTSRKRPAQCGGRPRCQQGLVLVEFFNYRSIRSILHDWSDAHTHGALWCIHLARANDLTVGSLEVEIWFSILCDLDFETVFDLWVLLDWLYAVEAGLFLGVSLAGEDDLAVGGLEVELEFSVLADSDDKFAHNLKFNGYKIRNKSLYVLQIYKHFLNSVHWSIPSFL